MKDYYCESILSGKVAVDIVAETDNILAFHHTFPAWDIHIVAIPKRHITRLSDVDDPVLFSEMFQVLTDIVRGKGFADSNYKIIVNGGSYQSNQHLHFHLVSGAPLDPENPAQKGESVV